VKFLRNNVFELYCQYLIVMFSGSGSDGKMIEKVEREIEKMEREARTRVDREQYSEAVFVYQEMARLAGSIDDKRAVDFCLDAAKYSMKIKNSFRTGWSYKCAADHSFAFNDFNNAINFAMKAIEYFKKSGSMYAVQWCYNIIGRASEEIKDYGLAVKNYKKSLDIEHSDEIDNRVKELLENKGDKKR